MRKCSTKKWIGLALAGLGAVASGVATAHQKVESEGGIKVYNPSDSAYWFSVGGRLNFDEVVYTGKASSKQNNFASGGNLRRAYLKFAGGVGDFLHYNVTFDYDGSNVTFQEASLGACSEYSGFINRAGIKVGQFVPPTTLDDAANYGTLNDNVFLESALATGAFGKPSTAYGVSAYATMNDMFMINAAAYQPAKGDNTNYGDTTKADRWGGSGRLTFSPVHTDDTVYHLGVAGRYQTTAKADAGQANLFWAAPETRVRNTVNSTGPHTLLNTGTLYTRSWNVVSAEALAMWGAAHVSGQYSRANVQTINRNKNPRYDGYHVQAGYVLTGEPRVYDFTTGTLRNPKPSDKCGAWEVVARYSFVNLNDMDRGNYYGGNEHNATLGLNWFVNEHVKLSANYVRANINPTTMNANNVGTGAQPATAEKRKVNAFAVRASAAF